MPISTISQTISTIPEAGRRGVDVQTTFVTKQEDFQDHLQGTTVTELNTLKTQINTTVSGMNAAVTNVNTKASEASASALSASNSAGVVTTKANEASASASQALTSRNQAETFAQQAQASATSINVNNLVHRTGDESIAGVKTFSSTIAGSINGNAATATTLTGLTPTIAELNYVDGVTSSIQTQLNAKLATTGTAADSSKLNGVASAETATASTIAKRNASGQIFAAGLNSTLNDTTTDATHYYVETGSDGWLRPKPIANVKAELLANPALTGTPTAPTATAGTNNTQIATTAYVDGKMVLATAVTASGTAIDFTSIPSWVKRITVMFNGVSTNGTSHKIIRLGSAGAIQTTGYVASSAFCQINASATGGGVDSTSFPIFSLRIAAAHSGLITFVNQGNNIWVASGVTDYGTSDTITSSILSSGKVELSSTLGRIRITTANGTDTFDAGSVNIMYEG